MDSYKKERSSRHHMKIEVGQSGSAQQQDEIFTLANPMTYDDITTPTSPPNQPPSRPSGQGESNPATPTTSHASGFSRTIERLSLKSKNRNQSFFKFFNRSNDKPTTGLANGGGGADRSGVGVVKKRTSMNEEELAGDGSSGSDHDDAFSPHSSGSSGDVRTTRQLSEPPKSPSRCLTSFGSS